MKMRWSFYAVVSAVTAVYLLFYWLVGFVPNRMALRYLYFIFPLISFLFWMGMDSLTRDDRYRRRVLAAVAALMLISFVCSTIIALIIGFVVPMGKISRDFTEKLNLDPESVPAKLLKALVSDLIYTPLITLAMVYMAYRQASAHGAPVNFWGMFLPSLLLSLVVAYFCIYFIEPIFLKKVMRDMNRK